MNWRPARVSNSVVPGSHPDQTHVPYCVVNKNCDGYSLLTVTCYGITGGDKWKCQKCGSYCVTAPEHIPNRPTNYIIR